MNWLPFKGEHPHEPTTKVRDDGNPVSVGDDFCETLPFLDPLTFRGEDLGRKREEAAVAGANNDPFSHGVRFRYAMYLIKSL